MRQIQKQIHPGGQKVDWGLLIGIIGIAVSIIAIPIGIIIARRARQKPELRYFIDHEVLLDPGDKLFRNGLHMKLGDREIESIGRVRIALWNERGDTIRKSDVDDDDTFRVRFGGDTEPLQAYVITESRGQIKLFAEITPADPSAVAIDFKFLDERDGGIIEVITQGIGEPEIAGTIMGATIMAAGSGSLDSKALDRISRHPISYRYARKRIPAAVVKDRVELGQGALAQGEEAIQVAGQGPWTASEVGQLEAALTIPAIRALITRLAKQAPTSLTFQDAVKETGIEGHQLRAQLGSLSKLTRQLYGVIAWPMSVDYSNSGGAIYTMSPKIAEWWLAAIGQ